MPFALGPVVRMVSTTLDHRKTVDVFSYPAMLPQAFHHAPFALSSSPLATKLFPTFAPSINLIMRYTHLFFDLDGTLTDSKPGILNSAIYAADKLGIPANKRPSDLMPFIGPPLRESFKLVFGLDDKTAEVATTYYREYYGKEGMHQYTIYDGIPEALETLSGMGYHLSVVTSKAEFYATQIIGASILKNFFPTVSGCELNGERSEKGVLIPYNASKLNLSLSHKILMIGDRLHDIRGAREAGVSAAAVLYGFGSEHEIRKEEPDLIVASPAEMAEVIAGG